MGLQSFLNKTKQAGRKVFLSIRARCQPENLGVMALDADRFALLLGGVMAAGAALYFAWPVEPDRRGLLFCAAAIGLLAGWQIRGSTFYRRGFCLIAFAVGFLGAWLHVWAAQSTVTLAHDYEFVDVEGRVETVIQGEKGLRLTLHPATAFQKQQAIPLKKLSLWIRSNPENAEKYDINPGDFIRIKASLKPPQPPLYPGDSDRRLVNYLEGNSATGFGMGQPVFMTDQPDHAWSIWIANIRRQIDRYLMTVLPGATGAVAAALLSGNQSAIPADQMQAIRNSGLAHLLSISGLHMSLVAGFFFLVIRRIGLVGQFLLPGIIGRWPIKKMAAFVALIAGVAYLALSGASIPAQRSFVALALVMLAIMVDRDAVNLRMVAVGLVLVVLTAPEQVANPGAQMSFLSVIALIASFQAFSKAGGRQFWRDRGWPDWLVSILAWPVGMAATSLIAGFATWPIALAYFHSSANYAVLSNMLAVPLASFWVMPLGVIGLLLMPVGLGQPFFIAMGWGIEKLLLITDRVALLPGAVTYQGILPDLFLVAVIGVIFLLALGWAMARWTLLAAGMVAVSIFLVRPPPDMLLSPIDAVLAFRKNDTMLLSGARATSYRAKRWQKAIAATQTYTMRQAQKSGLIDCDAGGCLVAIRQWHIALPEQPGNRVDDCHEADWLVSFGTDDCPGKNLVTLARQSPGWHDDAASMVYFSEEGRAVFHHTPVPTRPWQGINNGAITQPDALEP